MHGNEFLLNKYEVEYCVNVMKGASSLSIKIPALTKEERKRKSVDKKFSETIRFILSAYDSVSFEGKRRLIQELGVYSSDSWDMGGLHKKDAKKILDVVMGKVTSKYNMEDTTEGRRLIINDLEDAVDQADIWDGDIS